MQDTIATNIRRFLEGIEETPEKNDKQGQLASALVKIMDSLSSINVAALANRRKDLTEHKRNLIGHMVSALLFRTSSLVHLLDCTPEDFDVESLTALAESFEEDYLQDSILCATQAIGLVVDLMEDLFHVPPEDLGEDGSPVLVPEDVEESIAQLLATAIILCERFDLDLEIVMKNSTLLEKL